MANLNIDWNDTPQNVLNIIFSNLGQGDKFNVSLVNKSWCYVAMNSPDLWMSFYFKFLNEEKLHHLRCLQVIGEYIRHLRIDVNPGSVVCRESAVSVIDYFAKLEERQIQKFKIQFIGENPLLYSGAEFNDAIKSYFVLQPSKIKQVTLVEVDLSGLGVNLRPDLLRDLAKYHCKTLQKLYIQNNVLVETIEPKDIIYLVSNCQHLTHLGLHGCYIDDDVILALTSPPGRNKLKKLTIFCRRDQKYVDTISSKSWSSLVEHSPDLKVTLGFDHTCPLTLVSEVMKPEIPVSELFLETLTDLTDEIRLAVEYYHTTLRKMSVSTPPQNDGYLEKELINVAKNCSLLNSFHVFCVISESTISEILSLKPILEERKSYTLEHVAKPAPWIPGFDYYDHILLNPWK